MIDFDKYLSKSTQERITHRSRIVIFAQSFILLCALVIDYGFVLDEVEQRVISIIYQFSWWFYLFLYLAQILFKKRIINRRSMTMTLFMATLLLLSFVSKFVQAVYGSYNGGEELPGLSGSILMFFNNQYFIAGTLAIFSMIEISRAIVNFINRRTNPALLLSATFLIIIIFGALLLLVPRSTLPHIRLSVVDALFVSTSAVCVTGLSPIDVSSTFTLGGQIILLLLIQIGALGVMTFTSFFTLFFMGETGLYSQFALKDMIGSETFSSLISTLLYILGFTFAIEFAGVLFIWISIHGTMGMTLDEEFFFSLFHSISAFCNAGFSTLEGNLGNEAIMKGHNFFYIVISFLIILGGISFPILVNVKNLVGYYIRRFLNRKLKLNYPVARYTHLLNLNSRMVLYATLFLIVSGTILIALTEWNGAFEGMGPFTKIVHSFFNSVAPRTAGFNSVDLTTFSGVTIIFYTILMWIGGASQSTAGGIKVNTFMVAVANFISILKGRERTVLFNREITSHSVNRAGAIIVGSMATIVLAWIALVIIEPAIAPHRLLFETVSAIGTVGSSLNVTSLLSGPSKIILSFVMFIGRVGLITVLMSLMQSRKIKNYKYPSDNVIIN